jgi:hypothetical protein
MSSQQQVARKPASLSAPGEPARPAQQPAQQPGGNAFAQWELESIGNAVRTLEDSVAQLYDARIDGANQAQDMALEEAPPPWAEELLVGAATTAITGVAGYLGGPLLAAIVASPALQAKEKELVQGILDDILSDTLEASVSGRIRAGVSAEGGRHSTRAMFSGTKDGLGAEKVARLAAVRAQAAVDERCLVEPARYLRAVADGVMSAQPAARRVQMERSSVAFLDLLAQSDTRGQGAADLGRAGTGRSLWDMAWGGVPRGVVHLNVRYGRPAERPPLIGAYLQGVPEEMLEVLVRSGLPVRDLGLPVFMFGLLGAGSTLEIGRNDAGELSVCASGAESWLEEAARVRGLGSPEEAAAALLDEHASSTLAELGVA